MAKFFMKIRCSNCSGVIPLKDGGRLQDKAKKGQSIVCPKCEHDNRVIQKKNGKIKIS